MIDTSRDAPPKELYEYDLNASFDAPEQGRLGYYHGREGGSESPSQHDIGDDR